MRSVLSVPSACTSPAVFLSAWLSYLRGCDPVPPLDMWLVLCVVCLVAALISPIVFALALVRRSVHSFGCDGDSTVAISTINTCVCSSGLRGIVAATTTIFPVLGVVGLLAYFVSFVSLLSFPTPFLTRAVLHCFGNLFLRIIWYLHDAQFTSTHVVHIMFPSSVETAGREE